MHEMAGVKLCLANRFYASAMTPSFLIKDAGWRICQKQPDVHRRKFLKKITAIKKDKELLLSVEAIFGTPEKPSMKIVDEKIPCFRFVFINESGYPRRKTNVGKKHPFGNHRQSPSALLGLFNLGRAWVLDYSDAIGRKKFYGG